MSEQYAKKQTYEFCNIRNTMVRLDVIQVKVRMPDFVEAEVKLVPVACNRAEDCKRECRSCIVFDPKGADPCPQAWDS